MARVPVQNPVPADPKTQELLCEIETRFDRIRNKAFELFERRGRKDAVENWLEAEREFVFPAPAELRESETEFQLKLMTPGFSPEQIQVTAFPGQIIASGYAGFEEEKQEGAAHFSEWNQCELLRRIDLPSTIDTSQVQATLDRGVLKITAKKAVEKAEEPKTETKLIQAVSA